MKLNRAYTESLNDSIERIKLLFSDNEKFSRFNFTSKQSTMVDKNAVKVTGYYKLNKA